MQLHLDRPDYDYYLRSADGSSALVNERRLTRSFVVAPDALIEDWPVRDAGSLGMPELEQILALSPALVLLGTGPRQVFPPAQIMAARRGRSPDLRKSRM